MTDVATPAAAPAPAAPAKPSNFMAAMEARGVTTAPAQPQRQAPAAPAARGPIAHPGQQPVAALPDASQREQPIGRQPAPPASEDRDLIDPTAEQIDTAADDDGYDPGSDTGEPVPPDVLDTDAPAEIEMIHGVEAPKVIEALKAGTLPDELLEHVKVTAKVNGKDLVISAKEARDGYMRLSDYSRSKSEAAKSKQQADALAAEHQQFRQSFDSTMDQWRKDPESARVGLRELGINLDAIAEAEAREWVRFNSLPPEQKIAEIEARNRAQIERVRAQYEQRLQQLQQQPAAPAPTVQDMTSVLQDGTPKAFASRGLNVESNGHVALYREHLRNIWDPGTELTQAHMEQAAQATLEELQAGGFAAHPAPGRAAPAGGPRAAVLPPRAAAAPSPARRVAPQGGKPSDFAKFLEQKHDRASRR